MKKTFIILCCVLFAYVSCRNVGITHEYSIPNTILLRESLNKEVEEYIFKTSPRSTITPEKLVDACIEHGVDIIFVLAHGQIESSMGTAGIAARTNSVWNVHSHDGRTTNNIIGAGLGYDHPDQSIHPYLTLLKKNYLVNGKDEQDLMNNFVSKYGDRYASSDEFETKLRLLYKRIDRNTNINYLQRSLKKLT